MDNNDASLLSTAAIGDVIGIAEFLDQGQSVHLRDGVCIPYQKIFD